MKRKSSSCLRVNIDQGPLGAVAVTRRPFETKHERTLYVPYVFRKPLISHEQIGRPLKPELNDAAWAARRCGSGERLANQQTIGLGERRHHGGVLRWKWGRDQATIALHKRCAQVIAAFVVFR